MRSFRSSKRRQAGLGLLEVLLAITISLVVGAIAADQLRSNNETKQAAAAGDQLKLVGNAFNTYVALRYDKLVSLTTVGGSCPDVDNTADITMMGDASDPGPRCCDPATKYCSINSDTLRRNGLLPNSFSGYNSYGAKYKYLIRVQGAAPNFVVDGLVYTDTPYVTTGTAARYDLLGVAMQEAGADSGMTRSLGNRMEGLNGAWNESLYPTTGAWAGPTTVGLLGYRVGYGTSGFAAYLRLDGSSAMTGSLDMGNNGIGNVSQLRLNGPTVAGASVLNISANATSGATGTDITDAGAAGGLVVRNDNGLTVTSLNGTAQGTINAGTANIGGPAGSALAITANGLTGTLTAPTIKAGSINVNNGNVLIQHGYGLAFDPNDTGTGIGGWFIDPADTVWLKSINGLGVMTSGEMRATTLTALDHVYVGNISGATIGTACSNLTTTGYGDAIPITKSSGSNELVQCRNGFWSPMGTTTVIATSAGVSTSNATPVTAVCPAHTTLTGGGYALTNYVPGGSGNGANAPDQSMPVAGGWYVLGSNISSSSFRSYALCAY